MTDMERTAKLSWATQQIIDTLRQSGPFEDMVAQIKTTVGFRVPLARGVTMEITLRDDVGLHGDKWTGFLAGQTLTERNPSDASYNIEVFAPLDGYLQANAFDHEGARLINLDDIRDRGDFDMTDDELEGKLPNTEQRSLESYEVAMSGRKVDFDALIDFARGQVSPDREPEANDALRLIIGNGDVFDLEGNLKAMDLSLSSQDVYNLPPISQVTGRIPELINAGIFHWKNAREKEAVEDRLFAPQPMRRVSLTHDGETLRKVHGELSGGKHLWSPHLNGKRDELLSLYVIALCNKAGIDLSHERSGPEA